MTERADIVIIGGGVIGVCVADALVKRGVHPVLLERDEIASGASHGNAGLIFPSHSLPIPGPGVIGQGVRWLFDSEGPLHIRPSLRPDLLRWLWAFSRACNEKTVRENFSLRRALSLASLERYRALARDLDFNFRSNGLLLAFENPQALVQAEFEMALLEADGGSATRLSAEALREAAPPLSNHLAGGLLLPGDAHITPGLFVNSLATSLESRGAKIHRQTEVLEIETSAMQASTVRTTRGDFVADEIVIAAGAWSPQLTRQLGLRVPVEGAKGYSVTIERPEAYPELPIMLTEPKVGVTPMGETLRFAGTLELAGLDLRVNAARVRAIEKAVTRFLPGIEFSNRLETWRGLRPLTPDDLPIIGRPRGTNGLVLATGHGMTGISQGPITGELTAQLLMGETPAFDLEPFSPDRF